MGGMRSKLANVYKKYGFFGFFKKLWAYGKANYIDRISPSVSLRKGKYTRIIEKILENEDYDRVILWRSIVGYDMPLFQRPQHIANNLTKQGCLVFYEVTTMTDHEKKLKRNGDRLYLFNYTNAPLNRILMQCLKKVGKPKYLQLYSTDWKLSVNDVEAYKKDGFGFIYEYIDHISADIAGTKELPKNIADKYDYAMKDRDAFIVATADLLYEDVVSKRGEGRLAFSSNGVDYSFFKTFEDGVKPDKEFLDIVKKGKSVVMYYGALATWFDYDLLKKIASTGKYSIVLIGVKYDGSFDESGAGELDDVYFLGSKNYKVLKYYAALADVLTIPFKINDVTRSTNPVKLFEYMALQKPIVTTDMNECRKYKSVLIGDAEQFEEKLDEALSLRNDSDYLELLDREARENDWSHKAEAIISLLRQYE